MCPGALRVKLNRPVPNPKKESSCARYVLHMCPGGLRVILDRPVSNPKNGKPCAGYVLCMCPGHPGAGFCVRVRLPLFTFDMFKICIQTVHLWRTWHGTCHVHDTEKWDVFLPGWTRKNFGTWHGIFMCFDTRNMCASSVANLGRVTEVSKWHKAYQRLLSTYRSTKYF